jgi:hypothetical protein
VGVCGCCVCVCVCLLVCTGRWVSVGVQRSVCVCWCAAVSVCLLVCSGRCVSLGVQWSVCVCWCAAVGVSVGVQKSVQTGFNFVHMCFTIDNEIACHFLQMFSWYSLSFTSSLIMYSMFRCVTLFISAFWIVCSFNWIFSQCLGTVQQNYSRNIWL